MPGKKNPFFWHKNSLQCQYHCWFELITQKNCLQDNVLFHFEVRTIKKYCEHVHRLFYASYFAVWTKINNQTIGDNTSHNTRK